MLQSNHCEWSSIQYIVIIESISLLIFLATGAQVLALLKCTARFIIPFHFPVITKRYDVLLAEFV